ncbi:MAG: hypothetical protein JSV31_22030 [Desulfobacterales bacterium]|nr:MAG: hypothetical protein JSV31_22030 [Desulfobacterales bacterium]
MSFDQKYNGAEPCSTGEKITSKIQNLLNEMKDKGIFALAQMTEENKVMMTKWAQEISDRYVSVLEKHPAKIKNIAELPASKEEVKTAIKILLTAHVIKKSDEMVDILKNRYVSIGAFQDIDPDDKEKIIEEVNNIDQQLESAYESVFPNYHKYAEVIISEQNALLEDVNNFINDLKELKKTLNSFEMLNKQLIREMKRKKIDHGKEHIFAEHNGIRVLGTLRTYSPTGAGKRSRNYRLDLVSPEKDVNIDLDRIAKRARERYQII